MDFVNLISVDRMKTINRNTEAFYMDFSTIRVIPTVTIWKLAKNIIKVAEASNRNIHLQFLQERIEDNRTKERLMDAAGLLSLVSTVKMLDGKYLMLDLTYMN